MSLAWTSKCTTLFICKRVYYISVAELKTKKTTASPSAFIAKVKDPQKRADAKVLLSLMQKATGEKPKMWGSSIIGYGQYHYKSPSSSREGDWMLAGFSPRAANLTVYIMPRVQAYTPLLKKLGKYKVSGGSCIYINKLDDIDLQVLKKIVSQSVKDMKKKYGSSVAGKK